MTGARARAPQWRPRGRGPALRRRVGQGYRIPGHCSVAPRRDGGAVGDAEGGAVQRRRRGAAAGQGGGGGGGEPLPRGFQRGLGGGGYATLLLRPGTRPALLSGSCSPGVGRSSPGEIVPTPPESHPNSPEAGQGWPEVDRTKVDVGPSRPSTAEAGRVRADIGFGRAFGLHWPNRFVQIGADFGRIWVGFDRRQPGAGSGRNIASFAPASANVWHTSAEGEPSTDMGRLGHLQRVPPQDVERTLIEQRSAVPALELSR